MKLPKSTTLNEYIQPVKLTAICDFPHAGGVNVIGLGMGRYEVLTNVAPSDRRLRQAIFTTISSGYCSTRTNYKLDPNSIICAPIGWQTLFKGDSGTLHLLKQYFARAQKGYWLTILWHFFRWTNIMGT